ncbi:MAG: phenylacetate-CoA ligase [Acidimicrobiaceae bacterium]|nr:phenylacetate-CoA ligase [Acidimicrobiaceae bacterium]
MSRADITREPATGLGLDTDNSVPGSDSPYLDPAVETMPRNELRALQEARLLEQVPYVYERSALTQSVWRAAGVHPRDIKSLDDFIERVPFTDKSMIRQFQEKTGDRWAGLLCTPPGELGYLATTTGTTGKPTPLPKGRRAPGTPDLDARNYWMVGLRPGDYLMWFAGTTRGGHAHPGQHYGWTPIFAQLSTLPGSLARLLEASSRFRPAVLRYMSNPAMLALDNYAKAHDIDVAAALSSYKAVVRGGEPISAKAKQLAETWGLEMFDMTGLADIVSVWECPAHAGHHTWEDAVLVEYIDPGGNEPVPEGARQRAELVGTALVERGGPLVRYRTDDLVTFDLSTCSCGRTHGRLKTLGRKGDETIVAGRSILPGDILPLIESVAATADGLFQIVRTGRYADTLKVRVGYDSLRYKEPLSALRAELTDLLVGALDVPVEIELADGDELLAKAPPTPTKIPRVVTQ